MLSIEAILKTIYHLSKEEVKQLYPYLEQVTFVRKEIILEEGATDYYLYFIQKGIVRSYIVREGKESTVYFAIENQVALSSPYLTEQSKASFTLEASEDVILWRVSRSNLQELLKSSVALSNWGRAITERFFAFSCFYLSHICWMSKREQYHFIVKNAPELIQRVPLKDLASWLDITPQSLSRIRSLL